ncbi:Nin one binding Zn-ribbon like-domain-containing protein [Apiospora kogelbergensis]|uniref:20S-pre-rRNA D-site endonuclease NOB1 n=1 Tax=Apiospora kogelbergensis TaxID=1337665 RepID=A0AAW0QE06_9PEZI
MEEPNATPPALSMAAAAAAAPATAPAPSPAQQQASAEPTTTAADPTASQKPVKLLIVDTGPLIKNDPPLSTLLAQADEIYTLPSVLTEIRDEATRSRVQTQLLPFLKLRSPRPESVQFVTGFARRTGDLEVLSKPDVHLIALAYELECEKNGGDWRLRKEPGQKTTNGKSPAALAKLAAQEKGEEISTDTPAVAPSSSSEAAEPTTKTEEPAIAQEEVSHKLDTLSLAETTTENTTVDNVPAAADAPVEEDEDEDDDGEGWITPSNLKKRQAKDQVSNPEQPIQRVLQVALLTSDFAMQNVILRINLNLLSPSMARITRVKTWVQRCHGCFQVTRQMDKQFCPRCGQPTLTRVSATTDSGGNFTVHLKKNFQFNKRGNVYSIPKPVHGTSNTKYRGQGGGKGGWGTELLLAEDQKEYTKQVVDNQRLRTKDLMDEDYLPGILTGHRQGSGGAGKPRVGAGRAINSKKRNN